MQLSAEMSVPYRKQLVTLGRMQGWIQTEAIAQAFLQVPREHFVPAFFYREKQHGMIWTPKRAEEFDQDAWLELIYQDEALITKLDDRLWPISSSSAPAAMAMMLDALQLQPGMRVLEVGTGTGYNAALLAELVEDPTLVTTIDLDEDVTQAAENILHTHIGLVAVYTGDGRAGVAEHAPYDRIIVTASASTLPAAWYDQLAPGGRIAMHLQGVLGKSRFLLIDKDGHGRAQGMFDLRDFYFMPLREKESISLPTNSDLFRTCEVTGRISLSNDEQASLLIEDRDFHWWLQWSYPELRFLRFNRPNEDGRESTPIVIWSDPVGKMILQVALQNAIWSGQQRGGNALWQRIQREYEQWKSFGKPGREAYHVEWNAHLHVFELHVQAQGHRSFIL